MRRDPSLLLEDIRASAILIRRYLAGKTFDDYFADDQVRDTVERRFGIIGDALSQLSKSFPEIAERVASRVQIISFRNILIHGYHQIDNDRVWRVAHEELPALVRQVRSLIRELEETRAKQSQASRRRRQ